MSVLLDLTGQRFGRLTVVSRGENDKYGSARWMCACDCGGEKLVKRQNLLMGHTGSCGCQWGPKPTHGLTKTKEYQVWSMMRRRCADPKNKDYRYYGARGIRVCERWQNSFAAFMEDMGPRPDGHSIERVDNDGNYEPSNCKWATMKEQNNNKRHRKEIIENSLCLIGFGLCTFATFAWGW